MKIRTVLMSVTNKKGIAAFAKRLRSENPDLVILASGGTARHLEEEGIETTSLGTNECFGGRIKTIHPKIVGGVLFRRGIDDQEAKDLDIAPIDMVVCNLYDFTSAAEKETKMSELVEQVDIGGSTLIRSACKNHAHVTVVVDPEDYDTITCEVKLEQRQKLAVKAMNLSADYDSFIAKEFSARLSSEETHRPHLIGGKKLRYGENPDQEAWVYRFPTESGVAQAEVLAGKALSYNNYDDATIATETSRLLHQLGAEQGIAIIKHGNLCACATGKELATTFNLAWEGDTKSSFGSIIAFTAQVDDTLIPELKGKFIEVLIAPSFTDTFIEWAKEKRPNLRLLKMSTDQEPSLSYKKISGGMLVQTAREEAFKRDVGALFEQADPESKPRRGVVTKETPSPEKMGLATFAIATVTYAKSNAITLVREVAPDSYQLIGVGSGQPNRVDSLQRLAIPKAIENLKKEDLSECILASDGFFPFDDSIREAHKYGITTCIQPGGSNNDDLVIDAADELEMSMIFTGERYFTH